MSISIRVFQVIQNEWIMYVGVMDAADLYEIAKADRIRLETIEIPKYAGYQRPLVEQRVKEIRSYLSTPACTFPNSIIVSVDSDSIISWNDLDSPNGVSMLTVEKVEGAATIIDGQHRAAALDAASKGFQVIVTIFIDLDITKSAEVFTKINSTQRAVNPSIAYELFGYSNHRSPQKTAHDIATILNQTEGSPFYKKLLMLGYRDSWAKGTLSQATFARHLMRLYTKDYVADEHRLLRNEPLLEYPRYPLRKHFIESNDRTILEIVWKYFYQIAVAWPNQWNDETGKSILTKTTGYAAFTKLLRSWMLSSKSDVFDSVTFQRALDEIKEKYSKEEYKFVRDNYPSGSHGEGKLWRALEKDLGVTPSD